MCWRRWIPDKKEQNPQRKYSGTLVFTPGEGIVLRIMGQFDSEKPSGPLDFSHFKMICGRSTEDELISLYTCESAGCTLLRLRAGGPPRAIDGIDMLPVV